METFNRNFILDRIAEMEDVEHSVSAVYTADVLPEDAPENLKKLTEQAGKVVCMDYSDLGEDGHDAYGIFFFMPEAENDPCRYLSVVITVTEEVDDTGIYDLYQLMNRINNRIPEGAFVLSDDEKTLYYKNNVPLYAAVSD